MSNMRPSARPLAALLALTVVAGGVTAQNTRQGAGQNQNQNQAGATVLGDKPSPYVRQGRAKQWTVKLRTTLGVGGVDPRVNSMTELQFSRASINVPLVGLSGSSEMPKQDTPDGPIPAVSSAVFEINDRETPLEFSFLALPGGDNGTGVFSVGSGDGMATAKELEFEMTYDVSCAGISFNESRANRVEWPTGPWPERARKWLEPQAWVEIAPGGRGTTQPIRDFLRTATDGNDPKLVKPVPLAKWLTAKVMERVQINGLGTYASRDAGGLGIAGFQVKGGAATLADGEGTEIDMACALVAVLREAGLPSRLVIGYDVGKAKGDRDRDAFKKARTNASVLRPYVEFALYDEKTDSLAWVPVDIVAIRKKSSEIPNGFMDRPQRYFGDFDELQSVVPISFTLATFDQPGSASSSRPSFWTFTMQPAIPPQFTPTLVIDVNTKAKR